MIRFRLLARTPEETRRLGRSIGEVLAPGDLVLLTGDLGAGKTLLVKAVAEALGIQGRRVTSPTFALVHEYEGGRMRLLHADLYRLGQGAEIAELGLEEALEAGDAAAVVEWGGLAARPREDALWVELQLPRRGEPPEMRTIILMPGKGWEDRALRIIEKSRLEALE